MKITSQLIADLFEKHKDVIRPIRGIMYIGGSWGIDRCCAIGILAYDLIKDINKLQFLNVRKLVADHYGIPFMETWAISAGWDAQDKDVQEQAEYCEAIQVGMEAAKLVFGSRISSNQQ